MTKATEPADFRHPIPTCEGRFMRASHIWVQASSACLWIIEKVLEALDFMTGDLREYLKNNRVRPPGTEIITTKEKK